MNIWDILIVIIIAAAVILAAAKMIRDKRRGKSCCSDCTRCSGCAQKKYDGDGDTVTK